MAISGILMKATSAYQRVSRMISTETSCTTVSCGFPIYSRPIRDSSSTWTSRSANQTLSSASFHQAPSSLAPCKWRHLMSLRKRHGKIHTCTVYGLGTKACRGCLREEPCVWFQFTCCEIDQMIYVDVRVRCFLLLFFYRSSYTTKCNMDLSMFPFDTQKCSIAFESCKLC